MKKKVIEGYVKEIGVKTALCWSGFGDYLCIPETIWQAKTPNSKKIRITIEEI